MAIYLVSLMRASCHERREAKKPEANVIVCAMFCYVARANGISIRHKRPNCVAWQRFRSHAHTPTHTHSYCMKRILHFCLDICGHVLSQSVSHCIIDFYSCGECFACAARSHLLCTACAPRFISLSVCVCVCVFDKFIECWQKFCAN